MEESEQSQEIEVEELGFSEHAFVLEAGDLVETSDGQQTFCISEDGVVTKYQLAYEHLPDNDGAIQVGDGLTTEYVVFSSIEGEPGEIIVSSHGEGEQDQNQVLQECEIPAGTLVSSSSNTEESGEPIVSSTTAEEEFSTFLLIPDPNVHQVEWTSVDETIEEVIRQSISYAETISATDKQPTNKSPKKSNKGKDPMTLPFSYTGQSFDVQSQKLVLNVLHFFKTHKNDDYIDSIKTPQDKAAKVLNISPHVIGKIKKNWENGQLVQPGLKRRMLQRVLGKVDESDEKIIQEAIDHLVSNGISPTIPRIIRTVREQIPFTGSRTSFRRVLQRMGYRYAKIENKIVMIDPRGSTINIDLHRKTNPLPSKFMPSSSNTSTRKTTYHQNVSSSSPPKKVVVYPKSSKKLKTESVQQLQQLPESHIIQNQVQEFTAPISTYTFNLPISFATPSILHRDPIRPSVPVRIIKAETSPDGYGQFKLLGTENG